MKEVIKLLSNPTEEQIKIILDRISDLYQNPVHVIYEYIQNSIDSAVFLRNNGFDGKRYVIVHINEINKEIIVQDNCQGIKKEEVKELLTQKIFESKKKNSPWLLGEFGFGIQSFRSWFKKLVLITKHLHSKEGIMISFNDSDAKAFIKNQELGIFGSIIKEGDSVSPHKNTYQIREIQKWNEYIMDKYSIPKRMYGTDVFLKGLKKRGHRISLATIYKSLMNELSIHFESYLKKRIIDILVIRWVKKGNRIYPLVSKIEPIDYDSFFGKDLSGEILDPESNTKLAEYSLKIVDKNHLKDKEESRLLNKYLARIYKLGMEINKIAYLRSFQSYVRQNSSNVDLSVWERPELIGSINITTKDVALEISRTDIVPSREREVIYKEMVKITKKLSKEFNELVKEEISRKEEELSVLLTSVASKVLKELELELYGRSRLMKSPQGELFVGKGLEKEKLTHGEKRDVLPTQHTSNSQEVMEVSENKSGIPLDGQISEKGEGISDSPGEMRARRIKQRGITIEIRSLGEHNLPSVFSYAEKRIIINKDHPFYKQHFKERKNRFSKAFYMYLSLVFSPWIVEEVFDKFNIREKRERVKYMIETAMKVENMLAKTSDLVKEE